MPDTTGTEHTDHLSAGITPGRWVLDPAHSSVRFRNKTFWGLSTVEGEFGSFSGEGQVMPDGTAAGTLTVRTASLDTGNGKRDTHLRSPDFFCSEEHPTLVFTAGTITPAGADTAEVAGDLAIRGVSRPLAFTARVTPVGPGAVTLEAEAVIARGGFGMTWNQFGMLKPLATVSVTARFQHQG